MKSKLKRYLVFAHHDFEAEGCGWYGFVDSFDELGPANEAGRIAMKTPHPMQVKQPVYWHVVDSFTLTMVTKGGVWDEERFYGGR